MCGVDDWCDIDGITVWHICSAGRARTFRFFSCEVSRVFARFGKGGEIGRIIRPRVMGRRAGCGLWRNIGGVGKGSKSCQK